MRNVIHNEMVNIQQLGDKLFIWKPAMTQLTIHFEWGREAVWALEISRILISWSWQILLLREIF